MKMKRLFNLVVLALFIVLSTGCATILSGSFYNAIVKVENDPEAEIYYNDEKRGRGVAVFKAKRHDADDFSVTLKKKDCDEVEYAFYGRKFRYWTSLISLAGGPHLFLNNLFLPVPFGLLFDLSLGSLWKPDINEDGVEKSDFKNYHYILEYSGCSKPEYNKIEGVERSEEND
jgi:hypothetical protein